MFGRSLILGGGLALLVCGAAIAGDNNTLYLVQTSDGGSLANSFSSDQSNAHGNTITASQTGSGNFAHVTMCSGGLAVPCGGGSIELTQNDAGQYNGGDQFTAGGQTVRNYVSISAQDGSSARVDQLGGGNSATLDVLDGAGTIQQNGNDSLGPVVGSVPYAGLPVTITRN